MNGFSEKYHLAARVKHKLTNEAVSANIDLRKLVCQANLLDTLIDSLNATTTFGVSFENISSANAAAALYASDESDFSDSDSDSESDLSQIEDFEDEEDDINAHFNMAHATNFSYISNAIQTLNQHAAGYSENVEEVLSSDSESETELNNVIEYQDYDDDDDNDNCDDDSELDMMSLTRMVSNTNQLKRVHSDENSADYHTDDDEEEDALSNCSSASSLDDVEIQEGASLLDTVAAKHQHFPLLVPTFTQIAST